MRRVLFFLLLSFFCLGPLFGIAQQSHSLEILGDVKTAKSFSLDDLKKIDSHPISDLPITNHAGEPRGIAQEMKGFSILRLLEQVEFNTPSPRQLSEFYLIFEATDGYKVVFSWNELFNNELGKEVFVVTSKEGESLSEMEDAILLISHSDLRTGRRHVKNLSKITVKRVE